MSTVCWGCCHFWIFIFTRSRRRRFWHATRDCVVPYVDIILHRGRFWAKSSASGSVRWWCLRSCWTVLSHVIQGHSGCIPCAQYAQTEQAYVCVLFLARVWNIQGRPATRELDWWRCVTLHSDNVTTHSAMTWPWHDLQTTTTVSTGSNALKMSYPISRFDSNEYVSFLHLCFRYFPLSLIFTDTHRTKLRTEWSLSPKLIWTHELVYIPGTILTWSLVTSQVTWCAMYSPGGVPNVHQSFACHSLTVYKLE